ncbi:MAG: hypothetical protein J6K32_08065 [Clostridia bacterium]|nr:hypothetical protein [Clostridia bacterium]
MSTARSLFPGAMGPDGFISCFDHLIPENQLRRMIILKGGPGVGKSTFMRRVHAALGSDTPSTLYFCSGDPDSLDAVSIPDKGLLILDGTAPHIVDPKIPGARDSIINLGECLDEAAMRPRLPHIRACMDDHAVCTRRARACLEAACSHSRDNAAIIAAAMDRTKLARLTAALVSAVLCEPCSPTGTPAVRPVITDAVTPKGELCLLAAPEDWRVIRLAGHAAADATDALRAVSRAAVAAGCDVEEHLCPYIPGRLLHIGIPALRTLVTTGDRLASEQTFDLSACLPQSSLLRHECALEQGMTSARLALRHAAGALAQAKQLHDELETFYVPHMDFARWQTRLDAFLQSISAA